MSIDLNDYPEGVDPSILADQQGGFESVVRANRLKEIAAHIADRKCMSLLMYEPLPFQDKFHKATEKEVILRKGNQTGGSLAGFVEIARAVLGMDPHDKYPKTDGVACCLGFGESHIGKVIYPYLFMAGKFLIIRDEVTNEWRTYRPWQDEHRKREAKKSPPLIPWRYVKSISWKNKSMRIFDRVDFTTGWTLYAFNTSGLPSHAQGFTATLIHIDEDTDNAGWYDEMIARLTMSDTLYGCQGRLRWTAMPHTKNDDLVRLMERCHDSEHDEKREAVCIGATVFDNIYMPKATREENVKIWKSQGEDVYRKRALGEMVVDSYLMYPTFDAYLHNVRRERDSDLPFFKVLRDANWQIPHEWAKYMVVDPGHGVCAVTYWAVPPEELGDVKICFDESYIPQATATIFGDAVAAKISDHLFQSFIIDGHGGRLADIGSGIRPQEQYSKALKERRIASIETGHRFRDGSDDVPGRQAILRDWMSVRRDGSPKFMIDVARCPNTVKEFQRYRKKTVRVNGAEVIVDEGQSRNIHAVETCEYAAAHGLPYIKPRGSRIKFDAFDVMLAERAERKKRMQSRLGQREGMTITLGPVGVYQ